MARVVNNYTSNGGEGADNKKGFLKNGTEGLDVCKSLSETSHGRTAASRRRARIVGSLWFPRGCGEGAPSTAPIFLKNTCTHRLLIVGGGVIPETGETYHCHVILNGFLGSRSSCWGRRDQCEGGGFATEISLEGGMGPFGAVGTSRYTRNHGQWGGSTTFSPSKPGTGRKPVLGERKHTVK